MNALKSLPGADELTRTWTDSPRWRGIQRGYKASEVVRLRGTIAVEHEDPIWGGTLAKTLTGLEIAYQALQPFLAFPESQGRGAMAGNPGQ